MITPFYPEVGKKMLSSCFLIIIQRYSNKNKRFKFLELDEKFEVYVSSITIFVVVSLDQMFQVYISITIFVINYNCNL